MGNESSKKKIPISLSINKGASTAVVQQHLENAQKSRVLQLRGSALKGVPSLLENAVLENILRNLDLSHNKIRELPDFISKFTALKQLHLSHNLLTTLPDVICSIKTLEILDVSHNQLSELPNTLVGCMALRNLNAANNRIIEFPQSILHLPQPDVIDLSNNLIDHLPEEIGKLQAAELNLNANRLNSLHVNLSKCTRLKVFRVNENCLQKSEFRQEILADSSISLITYEGNLFQDREFQDLPGYSSYQERFTATKRKCA